jgi:hypothetical protein
VSGGHGGSSKSGLRGVKSGADMQGVHTVCKWWTRRARGGDDA